MSQSQIAEIASFLHEGIRAAAERGTYKVLNIVTGDPKAGEAYFKGAGKCATCHSPAGDLKGVGSKYEPIALQGRFLMPCRRKRGSTKDRRNGDFAVGPFGPGELCSASTDFNVALIDANGDYHSVHAQGGEQFQRCELVRYTRCRRTMTCSRNIRMEIFIT